MQARVLRPGDTIGIVSPSHVAQREEYEKIIARIASRGFKVKTGANLYKDTYGYLASEQERAADFNAMAGDDEVKMVFFGGGEGGAELLPYLDYESIREHPKLYASYSDGTSILNAIYARTGLITYYGQSPGEFSDLRQYEYEHFLAHFVQGDPPEFTKNSAWRTLTEGRCEGTLIGGYTLNFALLLGGDFYPIDLTRQYILFLEDHERFAGVAQVSALLSHVEQSALIGSIAGLLFGHYSEPTNEQLLERLRRFGEKHGVPVAYCDDFGHGINHGILPIGRRAALDTAEKRLRFLMG